MLKISDKAWAAIENPEDRARVKEWLSKCDERILQEIAADRYRFIRDLEAKVDDGQVWWRGILAVLKAM